MSTVVKNQQVVNQWKTRTTTAINNSKRTSRESRFIKRFSLWAVIWIGGFTVEPFIAKIGLPYYSTTIGYAILFGRDIILAGLSYWLWKSNFGKNSSFARHAEKKNIHIASKLKFFAVTVSVTALYFFLLANNQISLPFLSLPKALLVLYPLRIFAYVMFQQMTNTLFLMDTCVERLGFKDGLFFTSFMFGISHFGCMAINLPPETTMVLAIVSGCAMYLWGSLRKRYNSLFYSVTTHYIFWLVLQGITAGLFVWH